MAFFSATFSEGTFWKKIIDSIRELITDANFYCDETTGIKMEGMDSSHVSLCTLDLPIDSFDEYHCEKSVVLGINTAIFAKILKGIESDHVATIYQDTEDNIDILSLKSQSLKKKKVSNCTIKLMTLEQERFTLPEMEYSCIFKMPSKDFQKEIDHVEAFGECCSITVDDQTVSIETNGDIGSTHEILSFSNDTVQLIHFQETVCASFSLRYLKLFCKASAISSTVTISMAKELPMKVEFTIKDNGKLCFYLAPKLEET